MKEGGDSSWGIPRGGLCLTQSASLDSNGAPAPGRDGTASGADPTLSKGEISLASERTEVSAEVLRGNIGGGLGTNFVDCAGIPTSDPDGMSFPTHVGTAVSSAAPAQVKAVEASPLYTFVASTSTRAPVLVHSNSFVGTEGAGSSVARPPRVDPARAGSSVARPPRVDPARAGTTQGTAHDAPYTQGGTASGAPVPVHRALVSTEGIGSRVMARPSQVEPVHTSYAQDAALGALHPQGAASSAFIHPSIAALQALAGQHAELMRVSYQVAPPGVFLAD